MRWDFWGCSKSGIGKGSLPCLRFGIGMGNKKKFRDRNGIGFLFML